MAWVLAGRPRGVRVDRRDRPARRHRRCRPSPPLQSRLLYLGLRCPLPVFTDAPTPGHSSGPVLRPYRPVITPTPHSSHLASWPAACLGGGAVCAPSHPTTQVPPCVARPSTGVVNTRAVGFPSLVLCTSASQPSQSPTCLPAYTPTVALLCPPLCARVHACLPRVARHIQQARPLFQYAARDKPTGWRAWCCLPASRGDSPALRGRTVSSRGACARVRADVRTPASSANLGLPGGAQPFIGLW